MEALEFLKEAQRMCKSYTDCNKGCPLRNFACGFIRCIERFSDADIQCQIKVVEQWSKEHHIVTNEMKFCEIFGDNAKNSILALHLFDVKRWLEQPYKEPKHD